MLAKKMKAMALWNLLKGSKAAQPHIFPFYVEGDAKADKPRVALIIGGGVFSQDYFLRAFHETSHFTLHGCHWHLSKTSVFDPLDPKDHQHFEQLMHKADCIFVLHEETERTAEIYQQYHNLLKSQSVFIQMHSEAPFPANLPPECKKIKLTRPALQSATNEAIPSVTTIYYSDYASPALLFESLTPPQVRAASVNPKYSWKRH